MLRDTSIEPKFMAAPALAAGYLNKIITRRKGRWLIVSPTLESRFLHDMIQLLKSKLPHPLRVLPTFSEAHYSESLINSDSLFADPGRSLSLEELKSHSGDPLVHEACMSIAARLTLSGRNQCTVTELAEELRRLVHLRRAYAPLERAVQVMSIHSAKNQEWDHVAVVWPYEVTSNLDLQRRLLYNAITRACKGCYLIVQGRSAKRDPGFLDLLRLLTPSLQP